MSGYYNPSVYEENFDYSPDFLFSEGNKLISSYMLLALFASVITIVLASGLLTIYTDCNKEGGCPNGTGDTGAVFAGIAGLSIAVSVAVLFMTIYAMYHRVGYSKAFDKLRTKNPNRLGKSQVPTNVMQQSNLESDYEFEEMLRR
jgi:hypothetical protein